MDSEPQQMNSSLKGYADAVSKHIPAEGENAGAAVPTSGIAKGDLPLSKLTDLSLLYDNRGKVRKAHPDYSQQQHFSKAADDDTILKSFEASKMTLRTQRPQGGATTERYMKMNSSSSQRAYCSPSRSKQQEGRIKQKKASSPHVLGQKAMKEYYDDCYEDDLHSGSDDSD
ncbi:hypothetical protein CEUSTIGMA_g6882.t1 [Chlamydomonas eustigma]|uniref:Uncharacterized protein n=1 Tax=Chlamydomonas eustigma TaxID=1157962 RepID=A0A250X8N4_9CHLO|nr:hypothetical protein CEUSTIGMA_g6882.t1 [Chlamydomonas eustigma]|eukprot:GAX79441.1 hypothetical protein CEUSTIGMA_g6882.t1 [Chlamydomonas eustigma]